MRGDYVDRRLEALRQAIRGDRRLVGELEARAHAHAANPFETLRESLNLVPDQWRARKRLRDDMRLLGTFDPGETRKANMDIGAGCRFLDEAGHPCGRPITEGSRWCVDHADLWDAEDGLHAEGLWRGLYIADDGSPLSMTDSTPMSLGSMRRTAMESERRIRFRLESDGYDLDGVPREGLVDPALRDGLLSPACMVGDMLRWTRTPE